MDDEQDTKCKVIAMPGKLKRELAKRVLVDKSRFEEGKPYCSHRRYTLDTVSRRVLCRACGQEVDAFEVLLTLCHHERNLIFAQDELSKKNDEIESAKRELARVKAALKRACAK